jgi:hypothetical protein
MTSDRLPSHFPGRFRARAAVFRPDSVFPDDWDPLIGIR